MTIITETIPGLGSVPTTADPATFDARADTLLGTALPATITSMNTVVTQTNVVSGEVNTNANTASIAAISAAGSAATAAGIANYAGAWSTLTGAKTVPLSVDHIGAFWILLSNVADVTLEEPGTSASWARAYGAGQIEERASNVILTASDNGKIIKVTSGTFTQAYDTAANLGPNWSVTFYNAGTGTVTHDPSGSEQIDDATTKTIGSDQIAFISCDGTALKTIITSAPAGDHHVTVTTGNGQGSTNDKIRRFTTTLSSAGTDITYADSATLGGSFTINKGGLYSISYTDAGNSRALGVSVNSSQLTTDVNAITAADRLLLGAVTGINNPITLAGVFRFLAGDKVRAHGGIAGILGVPDSTVVAYTKFSIRKIGV